jgi:hypothetical protein
MRQLTTTATFTDDRLDDEALTTIVARSVLEAALAEDEGAELWFELGSGDETARLAVELTPTDLEELLRLAGSDDVALTLDGDEVAGLFEDADVEAHGMRGAIAIAVTSAALLAPAGQAAITQQSVGAAATTQRAGVAATTQVTTSSVQQAAVNQQAARTQAKLKRNQVAKFHLFKIHRSGLTR